MSIYQFPFCTLEEEWSGEYPYFSVCDCVIRTIDGKELKFWYSTEINPKGETNGDYYRRFAENYIPSDYTLDNLCKDLQSKGVTECDDKYQEAKNIMEAIAKTRGPSKWSLLYKEKKERRRQWRKVYNNKKWAKKMLGNPAHLLQWYLQGIDYTDNALQYVP